MKSKLATMLLLIFIIAGCASFFSKQSTGIYRGLSSVEIDQLEELQSLVEETLVWRVKTLEFFKGLTQEEDPLNGQELLTLHEMGTEHYRQLRERMLIKINPHIWYSDNNVKLVLTHVEESQKKVKRPGVWPLSLFMPSTTTLVINPQDEKGGQFLREIKQALAASLVLYDNYILAISQFQEVDKLRRILNQDSSTSKNFLEEVARSFHQRDQFYRTAKIVNFVAEVLEWEEYSEVELGDVNDYFNNLIKGSYIYQEIRQDQGLDLIKGKPQLIRNAIADRLAKSKQTSMDRLSGVFGNTVGLVRWRKGKMYELSIDEQQKITEQMRPLDVLLEKTPFRLTDKFIPGHWGHVAIWSGNQEQLEALGVWELLPELYQRAVNFHKYQGPDFQEAIESGHYIIEALRPGVQINTLEHFLNIDDLAVIRPRHLTDEQRYRYLITAFKQIGKQYDFNFDVESDKTIVCSELAYVVFGDEGWHWTTQETLGRATIGPDHVGEKAMNTPRLEDGGVMAENERFDPIILYHDGEDCSGETMQGDFDLLMRLDYEQIICRE